MELGYESVCSYKVRDPIGAHKHFDELRRRTALATPSGTAVLGKTRQSD
jgi:hypothetical protein